MKRKAVQKNVLENYIIKVEYAHLVKNLAENVKKLLISVVAA